MSTIDYSENDVMCFLRCPLLTVLNGRQKPAWGLIRNKEDGYPVGDISNFSVIIVAFESTLTNLIHRLNTEDGLTRLSREFTKVYEIRAWLGTWRYQGMEESVVNFSDHSRVINARILSLFIVQGVA